MMTIDASHEPEDIEKTVSFESGQFAIIDAEIVKSFKDKIPLADKAIFVATKQSRDNTSAFKITAEYDDATLRRLVIEPANADSDLTPMESIQTLGHEGSSADKKIAEISRISGEMRPKTAKRSERNKRYSKKGDPKTLLSKGKGPVEERMKQIASIDGAKRSNYGQPKTKVEVECMDLMSKAKANLLSEDYLNSVQNLREIRQVLADVRDNNRVTGASFDLVYKVVQQLDEHWHKSACVWVEDVLRKGILDV